LTNNVCFDHLNFSSERLRTVVFILLSMVYPAVSAETSEPLKENEAKLEADGDVAVDSEETVQEKDYNIYKKHNPKDPCDRGLDTYNYEMSWYDDTQVYVNSRFCEPALWFDNFFANDRIFNEGVAGTYIRWRNDFTYDEEEYFKFETDISFSVELPGAESRLRLTFDSGEDDALRDIAPGGAQNTTNSLGLQLDVAENERSKFNISVSLSPRVRLRYRYTYPVLPLVILRYTQEIQRQKAINSARTLIDVEKLFENQLFFRSSSEGRVSEEFEGVDWLQAFVLYQRINKKASLSYEISANGISEPRWMATNYRAAVRFRKNFHRRWLFYEISPEMTLSSQVVVL